MTDRHGAYKTPGGKLVAVDLSVDDGTLRNVQVHGDFFLHPEESLTAITGALDGAPADLSEDDFASRIAAAIPDGAEWLGSSPQALASAVRRALTGDGAGAPTTDGGELGFS